MYHRYLVFDFNIPETYLLHFKFACLEIRLAKVLIFKQAGLDPGVLAILLTRQSRQYVYSQGISYRLVLSRLTF